MAKLTYNQLQASFNRQMLGGQTNRVGMLRKILGALGHPEHNYRILHIAGTNGKGSTGQMLVSVLRQAGLRVGHFNSPAMLDQREQIRVDNQPISEAAFVRTYQAIVESLPADIKPDDLTIFEWWTLIMLQYFADVGVDWAVIEVGLGGTNDATNCIDAPDFAIITHLALDHTQILGSTIQKIAAAKAGIIKRGTRAVIIAPDQQAAALTVVQRRARCQNVPLVNSERVVKVVANGTPKLSGQPVLATNQSFGNMTPTLHLLGDYQRDNLTTVLAVVDCLVKDGLPLTKAGVVRALTTATLPGRLQVVSKRPTVVLDGAHNPDGASQLVESILHLHLANQPLALVVGFLADKDVNSMVKIYRQLPARIFVTTPDNPARALPGRQLAKIWSEATSIADGPTALHAAVKAVGMDGAVVVTGSFYLIKEIEALF